MALLREREPGREGVCGRVLRVVGEPALDELGGLVVVFAMQGNPREHLAAGALRGVDAEAVVRGGVRFVHRASDPTQLCELAVGRRPVRVEPEGFAEVHLGGGCPLVFGLAPGE